MPLDLLAELKHLTRSPQPERDAAPMSAPDDLRKLGRQQVRMGQTLDQMTDGVRELLDAGRTEQTRLEARAVAAEQQSEALAKAAIRAVDLLDDALSFARQVDDRPWIDQIERQLVKATALLDAAGLREVPALGLPQNPHLHDAVATRPDSSRERGVIVEVVRRGYVSGERLLRPAHVVTVA